MVHSLEMRAPFLGHEVIEFAFKKVPSSLKNDRYRVRKSPKSCQKVLPSEFDMSRKQGFEAPLNIWLKEKSLKRWLKIYYLIRKYV